MAVIFVLMRKDPLFALYGLGAQTFVESVSKYIFVCRWLRKPPVRFYTYLKWWILPAAAIGVSRFMHWQNSLVMMIAAAGIVFCIQFAAELKNEKGCGRCFSRGGVFMNRKIQMIRLMLCSEKFKG